MILFQRWRRSICGQMAVLLLAVNLLSYTVWPVTAEAEEHSVVYNTATVFHYDGSEFTAGQWFGYFLVGGFLQKAVQEIKINAWDQVHVTAQLPIALTNFAIPDVGVKLKTAAFCIRPSSANWPETIHVYEITPELCNEFTDISEHEINERDIDALHIAMDILGLSKDGVHFSNEVYAAMRFICWYVGRCGWRGRDLFMAGISEIKGLFDDELVKQAKFVSLCSKAADAIDKNIGAPDTGYAEYLPAFAGRYISQAPSITLTDEDGDGVYSYTYHYNGRYDSCWEYICPEGVRAEYSADSVTFRSDVADPSGLIKGVVRQGSRLEGILPAGGILICKSDDPETQDMLIPYSKPAQLACYAGMKDFTDITKTEFPSLPNVEFCKYEERFYSHYVVEGEKEDAETGQKLKDTEFEILERSPSETPQILDNVWGSALDIWEGWKRCKRVTTDGEGYFVHLDTRSYDYKGTYCKGHDEQKRVIEDYAEFISQCEEENAQGGGEDGGDVRAIRDTGDVGDTRDSGDTRDAGDTRYTRDAGDIGDTRDARHTVDTESDLGSVMYEDAGEEEGGEDEEALWDIEAMQLHLEGLKDGYERQIEACEGFASDPARHFFHQKSGTDEQQAELEADKQNAYDEFIGLEYDYTVREIRSRTGYLLHGEHPEDGWIPVVRMASSESGRMGYVTAEDQRTENLPPAYEGADAIGKRKGHQPGSLKMAAEWPEQKRVADTVLYKSGFEKVASPSSPAAAKRKHISAADRGAASASDSNSTYAGKTVKNQPDSSGFVPNNKKATSSDAAGSGRLFRFGNLAEVFTSEEPQGGFEIASWEPDWQKGDCAPTDLGPSDTVLFRWKIYDHHIEGELHINKQDFELSSGEKEGGYQAFGDTQGDAALEGAVYGLYAAEDIRHPDGKSGKIFAANELVAQATTDLYGNASFLTITEKTGGDFWIGRPLLLGRYYLKEISRSEGYELSITGRDLSAATNYAREGNTSADGGSAWVESIRAGGDTGTGGTVLEIGTEDIKKGVELYLYHYPEETRFGIARTGTAVKPGQMVAGWNEREVYIDTDGHHVYLDESGAEKAYYRLEYDEGSQKYIRFETDHAVPLYEQHRAGETKKDLFGNNIPKKDEEGNICYSSVPEAKTVRYNISRTFSPADVEIPDTITSTKNTANQLLKTSGYHMIVPGSSDAPWKKLKLPNGSGQEETEAILNWYRAHPFYNAAWVQEIWEEEGERYALLRYDYVTTGAVSAVLYGEDLYVKERIPGGGGLYYYVVYGEGTYAVNEAERTAAVLTVQRVDTPISLGDDIEDHLSTQYVPEYETYAEDTIVVDSAGQPVAVIERVPEVADHTSVSSVKTMDYLDDVTEYDPEKQCFHIYIRPERLTQEERDGRFFVETEHPGLSSVVVNGGVLRTGEYLKYVLGVTAAVTVPSKDWSGTYIRDVLLETDGSRKAWQDGGTRREPVLVQERVIKQKIRVIKDILTEEDGTYQDNTNEIHKDWFTENFGGLLDRLTGERNPSVNGMDNFRFKIYLKSNLERLYRNEEGEITWLNRKGEEVDIRKYRKDFPALVQDIYTKVRHRLVPLHKNSEEAVIANEVLYAYEGGWICDEAGAGYTRVLETVKKTMTDDEGTVREIPCYNYPKFYDAIDAANQDQWDRTEGDVENTSGKPSAGNNQVNTSDEAVKNAEKSDALRQFAVKWYLDDEVTKRSRSILGETYGDAVYDQALSKAIEKAEDYLKPFYLYDLDEIYAVGWDQEPGGGRDQDITTISADLLDAENEGAYDGVSAYLPYGCYVIAEQQPHRAELMDFKNKHYEADEPKEINLPAIYDEGGELSRSYQYDASMTGEQMISKYGIRFLEEREQADAAEKDGYIIKAHSLDGDFKVYKYGLALSDIAGHFLMEQEEYKPFKNYYHTLTDGTNDFYIPNKKVSAYYAYASISEQSGMADGILFPSGDRKGLMKDRVKSMQGMRTAYEGRYAEMLVPWSVTEPTGDDREQQPFAGYGSYGFHNQFYRAKLRIEKLDAQTGEDILHDGAVFAIYAADRDDSQDGDGRVKYYEKDTLSVGSQEFLKGMGARDIEPLFRTIGAGILYSGMIPVGTPVCREEDQILFKDQAGIKIGVLKAHTTTRDGRMPDEAGEAWKDAEQNVGYIETPQALGAGVYVLAEVKPPAGYKRTKPIAVEVYSDKITYYQDGERDRRVTAVLFEEDSSPVTTEAAAARVYVNNEPITLECRKVKTDTQKLRYRVSGRVDGSLVELAGRYGRENLEFAYNRSGKYMGYGWKKGTAECLEARKKAGQEVEIVYERGVFAGYGYVTRPLATADDKNPYVAGAVLTLYDAIPVKKSGDSEDFAYEGVKVERNQDGNIVGMYVEKGYAGETAEYVMEGKEELTKEPASAGDGTWTVKRMAREDTPILYYDLSGLKVTWRDQEGRLHGYDRRGHEKLVEPGESVYAVKDGKVCLEVFGGDLSILKYDAGAKAFTKADRDTSFYHVDLAGNRDAAVDPYTGMAYVRGTESDGDRVVYVWPVKNDVTEAGSVIARDKVKTGRIAAIDADTADEYVSGTWNSRTGVFKKSLKPVLDKHGLPLYYPKSDEAYKKGEPVYDRDGDFVRFRYDDLLEHYNAASYLIQNREGLLEKDTGENRLYHRLGEALWMENTWVSGDRYPNDPTRTEVHMVANDPQLEETEGGQKDKLKRVEPGHYIMEEITAPPGYVKAMPQAVAVDEKGGEQAVHMTDETIKIEISKIDAPDNYRFRVLNLGKLTGETKQEDKNQYSHQFIKGVKMALFKAKRVPVTDWEHDPRGYYLVKAEQEPYQVWVTKEDSHYLEGIPAGDYILEEAEAPPGGGYLKNSMELLVRETDEVQNFVLGDDHTKVELEKYRLDESGSRLPMPDDSPALMALYEAVTDGEGNIVMEDGLPRYDSSKKVTSWSTAGIDDYTQVTDLEDYEKKGILGSLLTLFTQKGKYSSFDIEYQSMYREYGQDFDNFSWSVRRSAERSSESSPVWVFRGERIYVGEDEVQWPAGMCAEDRHGFQKAIADQPNVRRVSWVRQREAKRVSNIETGRTGTVCQLWRADDGKDIRIMVCPDEASEGKEPGFCYQFDYKKLNTEDGRYPNSVGYRSTEGMQRIDYLPVGNYVLVEDAAPEGYQAALPMAVRVDETGDIQRFSMENKLKRIEIDKTSRSLETGKRGKLIGAELALYRAAEDGTLIQDMKYLTDRWTSDGKAHRIERIPDGRYYLVELKPPFGYAAIEPQLIEVDAQSQRQFDVADEIIQGRVEVYKHEAGDSQSALAGARFEIKNQTTGNIQYIVTGEDGKGQSAYMDIGEAGKDGKIKLFSFTIREITPPPCHQTDGMVHSFQFDTEGQGERISYAYDAPDEKTKLWIGKRDFEDGSQVKGACLAVYKAKVQEGIFVAEGKAVDSWVSDGKDHLIVGKLSADMNYLLIEEQVPDGYILSEPLVFTISEDGRRISHVTGDLHVASFETDSGDSVTAVTISGRRAADVYYILKDQTTGKEFRWSGTGKGKEMSEADDGIVSGHTYTCTEYTSYTDGNTLMTGKNTFLLKAGDDGSVVFPDRSYERTELTISDEKQNVIDRWTVENGPEGYSHTIQNPIREKWPKIEVISDAGRHGEAVMPGDTIRYKITLRNESDQTEDLNWKAVLNDQLEYLRATEGEETKDGIIEGRPVKIGAGQSYIVELAVAVKAGASGQAAIKMYSKEGYVEHSNPLAEEASLTVVCNSEGDGKSDEKPGGIGIRVTGETGDGDMGERTHQFQLVLQDSEGMPLPGIYHYQGSKSGTVRCEDEISLMDGQSIMIEGLPWGSKYEVVPVGGEEATVIYDAAGITGRRGKSAVFIYDRRDKAVREHFIKGGSYILTERTVYKDGSALETDKLLFALDEHCHVKSTALWNRPTHVVISKQELTGAEELPGACLQILDQKGEVAEEWVSGQKPHEIKAKLEPGENYRLVEILPPGGYGYAKEISFHVEEGGILEKVMMKDEPTIVEVSKMDITGQKECEGAQLQIRDEDNTLIEEWVSGSQPHVIRGKLIAGKSYTLSEVIPPDGYGAAEAITFTVSLNGAVDRVVMKDAPTRVEILKVEEEKNRRTEVETGAVEVSENRNEAGGSPGGSGIHGLSGAMLRILDQDGVILDEWISGEGPHLLTGKLKAGETYTLVEVEPPPGYCISEPVPFTMGMDGSLIRVVMRDRPTCIVIEKQDIHGAGIPGAHLRIINKSGTVVEDWISDGSPHQIEGILKAGEAYTLREVSAPDGYCTTEDIHFTVSGDEKMKKIVMKDLLLQVFIMKKTAGGAYLPGATLRIVDEAGAVVDEWITGEELHRLEGGLIEGKKYRLEEVRPPEGYLKAPPIEFIAKNNLKIVMTDLNAGLERPDQPLMKIIKKGRNGQYLAGAMFSVFRQDGSLYTAGSTDEEGIFWFEVPPPGSYRYVETEAPAGYFKLTQSFYFHVDGAGKVSGQLTVEDTPGAVVFIEKKDRQTKDPLAGCSFIILNESGEVVYEGTTDETGIEPVIIDTPGIYELVEIQAPSGYAMNEAELHFKVGEEGQISGNTVIYDDRVQVKGYKRGWVTAVYHPGGKAGHGNQMEGSRGGAIKGARTGDEMPVIPLLAACMIFGCLAGWSLWKGRRKR